MGRNLDIMVAGIKCDNPDCDFADMSVPYNEYDKWLNKPCPKCGANLLTQKDYDVCKTMMKIAKLFNKLPTIPGQKVHKQYSFNGEGFDGLKTAKYYNIGLLKADITQVKCDAIVNAANSTLLGGGGVDGAIHKAAGPELTKACMKLGGCKVGEAKLTRGYNLPSPFIIHTVAPQYATIADKRLAAKLLRDCYENSLQLAANNNLKKIAFPCLGTGVFKYPNKEAMEIATDAVIKFMKTHTDMYINFVCYLNEDYELYRNRLFE